MAKTADSVFFKRVHAAQMNEMEYAALLSSGLLFLHSAGVQAPWTAALALFGQVEYFWLRALVGHPHEGGVSPPPYVPGALARYAALGLLAWNIYNATA